MVESMLRSYSLLTVAMIDREKILVREQRELERVLFSSRLKSSFEEVALRLFSIQSQLTEPYREYISYLGIEPLKVKTIDEIPFLPISLFKSERITTFKGEGEATFTSSATTGMVPSKHIVKSLSLYRQSFLNSFRLFMGEPSQYVILALLPSYLEREGSSLVYMVQELINESKESLSGFYLYNYDQLYKNLLELKKRGKKTLLIGVTFALLDFLKEYSIEFPQLQLVETGGMKSREREISKEQLYSRLKEGFGVERVGSEYGMAELLSQAWSLSDALFATPPWMEVKIRDLNNPFKFLKEGERGGVNIIDLANIYSCSFIETEDMGIAREGGSFELLGRVEQSELRGCNLLL